MSTNDIPDWAIEQAIKRAGYWPAFRVAEVRKDHLCSPERAILLAARYIAAHEEAPVDPLYEALFAVVELGRYDTREQTALLREELAKRGLKIVEASK